MEDPTDPQWSLNDLGNLSNHWARIRSEKHRQGDRKGAREALRLVRAFAYSWAAELNDHTRVPVSAVPIDNGLPIRFMDFTHKVLSWRQRR